MTLDELGGADDPSAAGGADANEDGASAHGAGDARSPNDSGAGGALDGRDAKREEDTYDGEGQGGGGPSDSSQSGEGGAVPMTDGSIGDVGALVDSDSLPTPEASDAGGLGADDSGRDGSVASACGLPMLATTGAAKPSGTPGNLRVLPWAGLRGAMSYTFDDANSSQIDHYDELNALGVRLTFFLIGNKVSANQDGWARALQDGHELANHTQTHNSMTQDDVDQGKQTIESTFHNHVYTMAAPGGNTGYSRLAASGHMLSRGVWLGQMLPGNESSPSAFNTYCYVPPAGVALSDFNTQVDNARSAEGWGCVVVHGFTGGTDYAYLPVDLTMFLDAVKYAKSLEDMWIDSFVNIGAYWRGHNAFLSAQKTTSGSSTTWTWSLPANFPPGKCLRVTADGGSLTQGGKALAWDPHGYYELSLDGGSLTLSP